MKKKDTEQENELGDTPTDSIAGMHMPEGEGAWRSVDPGEAMYSDDKGGINLHLERLTGRKRRANSLSKMAIGLNDVPREGGKTGPYFEEDETGMFGHESPEDLPTNKHDKNTRYESSSAIVDDSSLDDFSFLGFGKESKRKHDMKNELRKLSKALYDAGYKGHASSVYQISKSNFKKTASDTEEEFFVEDEDELKNLLRNVSALSGHPQGASGFSDSELSDMVALAKHHDLVPYMTDISNWDIQGNDESVLTTPFLGDYGGVVIRWSTSNLERLFSAFRTYEGMIAGNMGSLGDPVEDFSQSPVEEFPQSPVEEFPQSIVTDEDLAATPSPRTPTVLPPETITPSIVDMSDSIITDTASGNRFRAWMYSDPERRRWAEDPANDLDYSNNAWNNSYMRKAWRRFGGQYRQFLQSGRGTASIDDMLRGSGNVARPQTGLDIDERMDAAERRVSPTPTAARPIAATGWTIESVQDTMSRLYRGVRIGGDSAGRVRRRYTRATRRLGREASRQILEALSGSQIPDSQSARDGQVYRVLMELSEDIPRGERGGRRSRRVTSVQELNGLTKTASADKYKDLAKERRAKVSSLKKKLYNSI